MDTKVDLASKNCTNTINNCISQRERAISAANLGTARRSFPGLRPGPAGEIVRRPAARQVETPLLKGGRRGLALRMDPRLGTSEGGELKNRDHGTVWPGPKRLKQLSVQESMIGSDLLQAL